MRNHPDQENHSIYGVVTSFAKGSPTAFALLAMFFMGKGILLEGLSQQAEIMKRQAEFNVAQTKQQSEFNAAQVVYNAQQNQFNQQILKNLDEITKALIDIHADVNAIDKPRAK